jgi:hypothetical protein
MRFTKAWIIFIIAILLAITLPASGCGGKKAPPLDLPSGAQTPVIVYSSYQAIAPVYNPDVPVVVIYPDGTMIKKEEPYLFNTGTLSSEQLNGILKSLADAGFFGYKKEYGAGQAKPGGATETLTVNLESGEYTVSVAGGTGPAGWNEIVDTVTGARPSEESEYIPGTIVLYAKEAPQVPQGATVMAWPGDLAGAAAEDGQELSGDAAALAWRAVQGVYAGGGAGSETYWKSSDGKTYTYVYARPELPGVEQ